MARCSPFAWAPAQSPATPSWTVAGAFGIRERRRRRTVLLDLRCRDAAAISTVLRAVTDLTEQHVEVLWLDGDHVVAPLTASAFESVVSTP
jgi:hypothetical protein